MGATATRAEQDAFNEAFWTIQDESPSGTQKVLNAIHYAKWDARMETPNWSDSTLRAAADLADALRPYGVASIRYETLIDLTLQCLADIGGDYAGEDQAAANAH